jgi:hypothetical protein
MFDFKGIENLLDEHVGGTADHSAVLWALLVLAVWAENE